MTINLEGDLSGRHVNNAVAWVEGVGWVVRQTLSGSDGTALRIDRGGALVQLEQEHNKIHEGQSKQFVWRPTLSGVTPRYLLLVTNGCRLHLKELEAVCEANDFELEFYESPTVSDNGTEQIKVEYNRSVVPDVCGLQVFIGPTVTDLGTLLDAAYLPGSEGVGGTFSGGSHSANWEFVLAKNTSYLFRARRLVGTGDARTLIKLRWYIEGPRSVPFGRIDED